MYSSNTHNLEGYWVNRGCMSYFMCFPLTDTLTTSFHRPKLSSLHVDTHIITIRIITMIIIYFLDQLIQRYFFLRYIIITFSIYAGSTNHDIKMTNTF